VARRSEQRSLAAMSYRETAMRKEWDSDSERWSKSERRSHSERFHSEECSANVLPDEVCPRESTSALWLARRVFRASCPVDPSRLTNAFVGLPSSCIAWCTRKTRDAWVSGRSSACALGCSICKLSPSAFTRTACFASLSGPATATVTWDRCTCAGPPPRASALLLTSSIP